MGSDFLTNQENAGVRDVAKCYAICYTQPFVRSSSSCEQLLYSRLVENFSHRLPNHLPADCISIGLFVFNFLLFSVKYQLRWAGHVSRMEDHRLPKIVMFGELSSGHRERGAPKKRFKDSLKKSLTACSIDHRQWSDLAADRVAWRYTILQAAAQFEVDRKNSFKEKRQRRKACAASTITPNISFPRSHCSRPCLSRIGLVSHERACSRRQRGLTS